MSDVIIRRYTPDDYAEICSWWADQKEVPPLEGMMTPEGTFVVTLDGEPVLTLTALMTQSLEISYLTGFCASPDLPGERRRKLGKTLWNFCCKFLKDSGYRRTNTFALHDPLIKRYQELGMQINCRGLTSLGKVL